MTVQIGGGGGGGYATLPLSRDDRPVIFAGNVYAANYVCETVSYD